MFVEHRTSSHAPAERRAGVRHLRDLGRRTTSRRRLRKVSLPSEGGAEGWVLRGAGCGAAGVCGQWCRSADPQSHHVDEPSRVRLGEPGVAALAASSRATGTPSSATTNAAAGSRIMTSTSSRSMTWVADLETVVDAAGVDRFALLGISQGRRSRSSTRCVIPSGSAISSSTGATPAAGTSRRGTSADCRRRWSSAIAAGWTDPRTHVPPPLQHAVPPARDAPSRWRGTTTLQRHSTSAETAVAAVRGARQIDVVELGGAGDNADARRPCARRTASCRSRRAGCSPR